MSERHEQFINLKFSSQSTTFLAMIQQTVLKMSRQHAFTNPDKDGFKAAI